MIRLEVANEAEWHAIRAKHVGASESPALMGCQADYQMSPFQLWQVKAGRVPPPEVDSIRVQCGKRFEAAAAGLLADLNNWEIEQWVGYAESEVTPGMGCTPDYRVKIDGDEGLLEIKWTDFIQHKRAWTNDEPPAYVLVQLQHQLHVTGHKWGIIGVVVGGNQPMFYRYDYRPKVGAEIERRIAAFWQSIRDDKPPAPDATDGTAAALAALYPEATPGKPIELDGDNAFPQVWADLIQARLNRKAAEAAEQAGKNWLLDKIKDAELIRYGGTVIATCKTQHRKAYQVKESSSRVLRIMEK